MRWVFLFLLALNLGYIAWELQQTSSDDEVAEAKNEKIPKLVLLHELNQGQKVDPSTVIVELRNKNTTLEKSSSKKSADKVKAKQQAKKNKPANLDVASANKLDVKSDSGDKAEKTSPDDTFIHSNAAGCYTLGPFRELKELSNFTRAIKNYVAEATYRSREEQEQSMFWVFIKPVGDRNDAREVNASLHKKEIKDTYIINSGPQNNGISLGHYREKSRAYSHAESINSLGFEPVVEPVFRTYTIYWLDYRVRSGGGIPSNIFDNLLTQKVSQFNRSCT